MRRNCSLFILAVFSQLLLCPSPSRAHSEKNAPIRFQSLKDSSVLAMDQLLEEKNLFVLFQPDCGACRKALQNLKCGSETQIVALGSFAPEAHLRKEVLKLGLPFPAYQAPDLIVEKWELQPKLTPQFVVTDKAGKVLKKGIGPVSCKDL